MRYYLAILVLFILPDLHAQTPYDLSFAGLRTGQTVTLSQYAGKKLLVVVINAAAPNTSQLRMLDSLYRQDSSSLTVLGMPADDFGEPLDDSLLYYTLSDSLGLACPLAKTGKAKKASEENQQVFLYWLTHASENFRFDQDITEAGRTYLLSETGSLYGLFASTVTAAELDTALHQTITN